MNNNETFRDYFRRARYDPAARAQLVKTARYSRSLFGWIAVVFTVLAVWQIGYERVYNGIWFTRGVVIDLFGLVNGLYLYDKLGERVIVLEVMNETPNHLSDPTFASGTSPAEQEPRLR